MAVRLHSFIVILVSFGHIQNTGLDHVPVAVVLCGGTMNYVIETWPLALHSEWWTRQSDKCSLKRKLQIKHIYFWWDSVCVCVCVDV